MTRTCNVCNETKPLDADHFAPTGLDNKWFLKICRDCRREQNREYMNAKYANNAEFRLRQVFRNRRTQAKRAGIAFTITEDWVIARYHEQGKCCARTGVQFDDTYPKGKGIRSPWSPSIDRIDPYGGYTPENVQIVASIYNTAKNTHTDADVMRMAFALVERATLRLAA